MNSKMESLTKLMQSRHFYPTELSIWVDHTGLFHGKVYGNDGVLLLFSHNKQFINELLEELNDEASAYLVDRIRGEKA